MFLKMSLIFIESPTLGHGLWSKVVDWKPTLQDTYVPSVNAFPWAITEIWGFEKLANKTDRGVQGD